MRMTGMAGDDGELPRGLFGIAPGAGFVRRFVEGFHARYGHLPPERIARIEIRVTSRRMARETERLFLERPLGLMPRIRLIEDLAREPHLPDLSPPPPRLLGTLQLARLVEKWLEKMEGSLARESALDLADRLLELAREMEEDGISPELLCKLDTGDLARYWQRTREFLKIVLCRIATPETDPLTAGGVMRRIVEALGERWRAAPPSDPVIILGSTGSRGPTRRLMEIVASLPLGVVVLPGADRFLPERVATRLAENREGSLADHPQQRHAALLAAFGMAPADLPSWQPGVADGAVRSSRLRLVSLALRPAPVTDEWLAEVPALGPTLEEATKGLVLLEAPTPVQEAAAIAVAIRRALEAGHSVAFVVENRTLARRVTGILDNWKIRPDDSAGIPFDMTPPGRLLRQIADMMGRPVEAEPLLSLLKHPLVAVGKKGRPRGEPPPRRDHLDLVRNLELYLRDPQSAEEIGSHVTAEGLAHWREWREKHPHGALEEAAIARWDDWLDAFLDRIGSGIGDLPLHEIVARHEELAEMLVAGPGEGGEAAAFWEGAAGKEARRLFDELLRDAGAFGAQLATPYPLFLAHAMTGRQARPEGTDPRVRIVGPREMREIEADILVLGDLNEGSWPAAPGFDPWLSRPMRRQLGMRLPERQIGLAGLDFQMALGHENVILSRAIRDEEAPCIPSRWLLRLVTLIGGCGEQGTAALEAMKDRGKELLGLAEAWLAPRKDEKADPAPRPAPVVPVAMRPRRLSITRISSLIVNPYEIHAREVLGLERLGSLRREPDALLEGNVLHRVLQRFGEAMRDGQPSDPAEAAQRLGQILDEECRAIGWPLAREVFRGRFEEVIPWLLAWEAAWREQHAPVAFERKGEWQLKLSDGSTFTLSGRADRIDRRKDGRFAILDYKRSSPPGDRTLAHDWQLQIEALFLEEGVFEDVPKGKAEELIYLGLLKMKEVRLHEKAAQRAEIPTVEEARERLATLLNNWRDPERGYVARGRVSQDPGRQHWHQDYDHLARFGEWVDSDEPTLIRLNGFAKKGGADDG